MIVILQNEYSQRVKKRSFIIATLLTPIIILAISAAPALIAMYSYDKTTDVYNVAVFDKHNVVFDQLKNNNYLTFSKINEEEIEKIKTDRNFSAILHIDSNIVENHKNIQFEMFKEASMKETSRIESQLKKIISNKKISSYDIENLPKIIDDLNVHIKLNSLVLEEDGNVKKSSSAFNFAVGYVGGFLIYIFIFAYGSMILNSVIDEKSSKVVEVMVSTISPSHLMMGKILGIGLVAVTQFLIWGVILMLGGAGVSMFFADSLASNADMVNAGAATMSNQNMLPQEISMTVNMLTNFTMLFKIISVFLIYFLGGYLFYGAFFAAVASAVDNIQDVQQLQMPIMLPIIASLVFLSLAVQDPYNPIAFWLSIIPFTSPIIMLGRITSDIPIWEIALSIVLLYASFIGMLWVASRIYRVGIFMHGKKPSFKELYKWIKYK